MERQLRDHQFQFLHRVFIIMKIMLFYRKQKIQEENKNYIEYICVCVKQF